jgi:hypothetical protein
LHHLEFLDHLIFQFFEYFARHSLLEELKEFIQRLFSRSRVLIKRDNFVADGTTENDL